MPTNIITDINTTKSLNIIDGLSMNLDERVQFWLSPLYHEFPILANTFFGIPLANLFGAILVFLVFLLFRHFFTLIIMGSLIQLSKFSSTYYDERVLSSLKAPVRFGFIIIGAHIFFLLTFQETPTIKNILNTLVIFIIFWAIISTMNALRGLFHSTTAKFNPDLAKEMGDFILKISKVIVVGVGLGAMLQVWGINVTALVASLGLGGLAFALAAKDTAANLFGSFALLADKSIRIGEWIKVGDVEGVVEDIGMRSTKIRSFEKSLITVPNQTVSNAHIENFSRRGIRRIKLSIGVTYKTSGDQLYTIVQEIEYMLRNHIDISSKDTLIVSFDSFGDSSLNIFIYAFTNTANWDRYMNIKQDINLKIMKIVEENNSSFAFPSTSLYIEK